MAYFPKHIYNSLKKDKSNQSGSKSNPLNLGNKYRSIMFCYVMSLPYGHYLFIGTVEKIVFILEPNLPIWAGLSLDRFGFGPFGLVKNHICLGSHKHAKKILINNKKRNYHIYIFLRFLQASESCQFATLN